MEQKAIDNAFKDGQLLDDLNGSHTRPIDTSGTSNGLVNKKSSNATGTSRLGGAKSKAAYYLDFQAGLITKEEYDVFAARLGTYNTDAVNRKADTSLAKG